MPTKRWKVSLEDVRAWAKALRDLKQNIRDAYVDRNDCCRGHSDTGTNIPSGVHDRRDQAGIDVKNLHKPQPKIRVKFTQENEMDVTEELNELLKAYETGEFELSEEEERSLRLLRISMSKYLDNCQKRTELTNKIFHLKLKMQDEECDECEGEE